ncbi:MAG: aminotransferase class I/II-fold pyridoxal phosphate-dependent enzyme [Proteobacteria bacterium]|nr:aminotransferase class I/II-fold pyridoxal phosphate-dependent enzyme [Pseudomonadota bacterium]
MNSRAGIADELKLSAPDLGDAERAAVDAVLRRDQLTLGPELPAFEDELARWVGARHAVAVSSGTAALVLALQACDIGAGDEVIVPSFTFPATINAVALVGAQPVIVDVDAASWNLDVAAAAAALTPRTRALLPVDVLGLPAPRAALRALARRSDPPLAVIEDAACALGATCDGLRCGSDSQLACLSFHPRKIITTGEGGAVLTRDAALAARCVGCATTVATTRGPSSTSAATHGSRSWRPRSAGRSSLVSTRCSSAASRWRRAIASGSGRAAGAQNCAGWRQGPTTRPLRFACARRSRAGQ